MMIILLSLSLIDFSKILDMDKFCLYNLIDINRCRNELFLALRWSISNILV